MIVSAIPELIQRSFSEFRSGALFTNPCLLFLLIFPFFEPESLGELCPFVSVIFNLGKVLAFCLLITYTAFRRKISSLCIAVALFQAYLVVVTMLHGGRSFDAIKAMASVVTICLIIDVSTESGALYSALRLIRNYLLMWAVVSIVLTIVFPQGLYLAGSPESYANSHALRENAVRFFLGHKNQIVPFLFPGYFSAAILGLNSQQNKDKMISWLMLLIMCVTAVTVDSMTSVLLCIFLAVAYLLCCKRNTRHLSVFGMLSLVAGADVGISLFRLQELAAPLFNALGRDVTLSNRTNIWDGAIDAISKSPVFGWGVVQDSVAAKHFAGFNTAHNMYLTNAYYGGLVGVLAYVACVYHALYNLRKSRTKEANFILLAVCGLLFMGIVESLGIGFTTTMLPLAVAFNFSRQSESTDKDDEISVLTETRGTYK